MCSGFCFDKQGYAMKIIGVLYQNQLSLVSLNLQCTCFGSKSCGRHGGVMVSMMDSRRSSLGALCHVLGKKLYCN